MCCADPPLATAETLKPPFDLVLLSCKAFDLEGAIDAMAPAVGPTTTILPLLNGMSHMDALNARFGKERVLGGWRAISIEADHVIGDMLKRGERAGQSAPLLGLAHTHVKTCEARKAREAQRRTGQ